MDLQSEGTATSVVGYDVSTSNRTSSTIAKETIHQNRFRLNSYEAEVFTLSLSNDSTSLILLKGRLTYFFKHTMKLYFILRVKNSIGTNGRFFLSEAYRYLSGSYRRDASRLNQRLRPKGGDLIFGWDPLEFKASARTYNSIWLSQTCTPTTPLRTLSELNDILAKPIID